MRVSTILFSLGMSAVLSATYSLAASAATTPANHIAPAIERFGRNLGLEDPSAPLSATVWLNLHNSAQLDEAVQAMYTPDSPTFHKWLTLADLKQYGPTAAEVAAVQKELAAHHLNVVSTDPLNFSIKVQGRTSDFEAALQTRISRYEYDGQIVHTTSGVPQLSGQAGTLVASVAGFNSASMKSDLVHPLSAKGQPQSGIPLAAVKPADAISTSRCFFPPSTIKLSVQGDPTATGKFSGLTYGANSAQTGPGGFGCAYTPKDLYKIYGLEPAFSAGYRGQGQTVVIIDPYGSPTIQSDADTYDSVFGLPALTPSNFTIYNPFAVTKQDAGWAGETTLDVESSHAIAPGANIALVLAFSANDNDLQDAIFYAVTHGLGNAISNSYSGFESGDSPQSMSVWNEVCKIAASLGVSVHFATGDRGDLFLNLGYTDVPVPANAPYATGIGGTSAIISPINGAIVTTGWGTNVSFLSDPTGALLVFPIPYDYPNASSFFAGAGGGISAFFNKPAYQANLPGAGRHIPDVSALADPETGFPLVFTSQGVQQIQPTGGTSLATPLFSGMWAILNQVAGTPLGQAAPYVSNPAASKLIKDVLPINGPANVTGSIDVTASSTLQLGTYDLTAQNLAEPFYGREPFVSSLWNVGGGEYLVLTFGTDSSLQVTQGWDAVTGYGTPNLKTAAVKP